MGRRSLRHPEQVLKEIVARAEETSTEFTASWRYPFGWILFLYEGKEVRVRDLPSNASYEDAVAARTREMMTGRFEKAWLEQRRGP